MTQPCFQAAIFDLDGTLIDSMPYWKGLIERFLDRYGLSPDGETRAAVAKMSLHQSAVYLKNRYCLEESVAEIHQALKEETRSIYTQHCTLKEGVKDYLDALKRQKIPMAVATLSEKKCAKKALARLGIKKYFSCLMTDEDVGKSKNHPDLYLAVAKKLKTRPEYCAVYEDSRSYAAVAKQAGFQTYAVKDPTNASHYDAFVLEANGEAPWQ